jgi:uncharacterized protein (TIGR03083 family)
MGLTDETTLPDVAAVPRIDHHEAMALAETEFTRMVNLLRGLDVHEWEQSTVCREWDVRAMVAHVVGMAEAQASVRQFAHDYRAASRRRGGAMIDAMTAAQVRDRAELTPAQLTDRLAAVAPRAVRARRRVPPPIRWAVRMKQDPPFDRERWRFGYLVDTIFTRDTWMHRLDICRGTGREMAVTPEHDGRLIADVVAEWARRHGQPFTLTLTGPVGGQWRSDAGGEHLELDALEFCWTLAGRASASGLLATPVPF